MAKTIKKITPKDIKIVDNNYCFSTSFLADILHVTSQTVNNWEKQGCPKVEHGYFCLFDVLNWREDKLKRKSIKYDPEDMSLDQQKTYYEVQLKKVQGEYQELKTSILNGDYLEKKDVVAELKRVLVVFKRAAYGMGKKVSGIVGGYVDVVEARKVDNLITDTINDSLEQMSRCDFNGKK